MPAFSGVLIPNPPYVLLGESYHGHISIGLDYNLFTYWFLIYFQTLMQPKFPTMGHFLSTWVWVEMLKFRSRFLRTWWIHSNIALDMGFPKVIGLAVILYSYSIKDFMSSWSINSFPWSWVISIGLGYLESHAVSTKFAIYMALLSLYCAISKHHIIGLIIVTHFKSEFYFLPFLPMIQGPIISTQVLFRHFSSANLSGSSPYFLFDHF